MAELDLNTPIYGSTYSLDTRTLTRETAGGRPIQVRPSTWNNVETHRFIFNALTKSQSDSLREFACVNAGKDVTITDEFGNAWLGVIESEIKIQQIARRVITDACDDPPVYDAEFSFEGSVVGEFI